MSEWIDTKSKRAAIALSEELDFARAAIRLGVPEAELTGLISELERRLCLNLFESQRSSPHLTKEGAYLVRVFRAALAADNGH